MNGSIYYLIQFHEKVKGENSLLTRQKPTISHWADVVEREPVGQFGHRLVSNLVWLETAKINVENKMV